MGYASSYAGTEKITLTNPAYFVEIKTCLTRAETRVSERELTRATMDMQGNGAVSPDVASYRDTMVKMSIVSWNLDDDEGNVIPIDPGILDDRDFELVWTRVNSLNSDKTKDEQERFPGQS